jgi:hypothetical protein
MIECDGCVLKTVMFVVTLSYDKLRVVNLRIVDAFGNLIEVISRTCPLVYGKESSGVFQILSTA